MSSIVIPQFSSKAEYAAFQKALWAANNKLFIAAPVEEQKYPVEMDREEEEEVEEPEIKADEEPEEKADEDAEVEEVRYSTESRMAGKIVRSLIILNEAQLRDDNATSLAQWIAHRFIEEAKTVDQNHGSSAWLRVKYTIKGSESSRNHFESSPQLEISIPARFREVSLVSGRVYDSVVTRLSNELFKQLARFHPDPRGPAKSDVQIYLHSMETYIHWFDESGI